MERYLDHDGLLQVVQVRLEGVDLTVRGQWGENELREGRRKGAVKKGRVWEGGAGGRVMGREGNSEEKGVVRTKGGGIVGRTEGEDKGGRNSEEKGGVRTEDENSEEKGGVRTKEGNSEEKGGVRTEDENSEEKGVVRTKGGGGGDSGENGG